MKCPISKETFCKTISSIKHTRKKEEIFSEALRKICPENLDVFLYTQEEEMLVSLLNEIMREKPNTFTKETEIEYFIYELNFGDEWKEDSIFYDGKTINMSTPELLYDFLIMKNFNKEI